ncbi:MAG: hypothetical protein ACLFPW_13330 [Spirochaetaceae bacterium]
MQGSLVSARLVFALLIALFASGDPSEEKSGVLVDRISGTDVVGSYEAVETEGTVALTQVEARGAAQSLAMLERVDSAAHLFAELENQRVYSLEEFFREEYTLSEGMTTTMELPVYPEAMIRRAAGGSDGETDESPEERVSEEVPTASWRFLRSGELLYLFPGGSDEIFVVRPIP